MMTLTLDIVQNDLDALDADRRERLAVALYDARLISQGRAAELAGLSRRAFIDALGRHGVSVVQYDSADEILAEADLLARREQETTQRIVQEA